MTPVPCNPPQPRRLPSSKPLRALRNTLKETADEYADLGWDHIPRTIRFAVAELDRALDIHEECSLDRRA